MGGLSNFFQTGVDAPEPIDIERLLEQQVELNRLNTTTPFGSLTFSGGDPIFEEQVRQERINPGGPSGPVGGRGGRGAGGGPRRGGRELFDRSAPGISGEPQFRDVVEQVEVGRTPREASFALSPELQRMFDVATSEFRSPEFRRDELDPIMSALDFSDDRQRVEDALFERQQRLLDPLFGARERQLRTSLSLQGHPSGAEGRGGEFGDLTVFERERNRAFERAALNSVLAGGQEQSRLLGESRATRGQQIADQMRDIDLARTDRARELNEFLGLFGGQQIASPRFTPIDVTGPTSLNAQQQQAAFQAQMGLQEAKLGGATDLGLAGLLLMR